MKGKMLGGILLIVGTTIGGGMLALPVVTAQSGVLGAIGLLITSWMLMTFCAYLVLEVNLWMPKNSNIIMMAKKTLGLKGEIISWICYLLLFYCLLAAYIAGGTDILQGLLTAAGLSIPIKLDYVVFTGVLGAIVYHGIRTIDYANRALMFVKLTAFILLVLCIAPFVDVHRYVAVDMHYIVPAITVVITSYGFSTIIPSLRVYFNDDVARLRKVIFIGSFIPLLCYIAWILVILGGIPFTGEHGMLSVVQSDHSTLALSEALIYHINNTGTTTLTRIFTSVCVLTSFLNVSLCVVDFLADGLRMEKIGWQKVLLHVATFLPPLVIAMLYPTAFIVGLSYAGICLAILIIMLPALMVWKGRYIMQIKADYRVVGGKLPLVIAILVAVFIIVQGLFWRT